VLGGRRVCPDRQVLETLLLELLMQGLVVVVEVLGEAVRRQVFDL